MSTNFEHLYELKHKFTCVARKLCYKLAQSKFNKNLGWRAMFMQYCMKRACRCVIIATGVDEDSKFLLPFVTERHQCRDLKD